MKDTANDLIDKIREIRQKLKMATDAATMVELAKDLKDLQSELKERLGLSDV